jgi:hypothetical protein
MVASPRENATAAGSAEFTVGGRRRNPWPYHDNTDEELVDLNCE